MSRPPGSTGARCRSAERQLQARRVGTGQPATPDMPLQRAAARRARHARTLTIASAAGSSQCWMSTSAPAPRRPARRSEVGAAPPAPTSPGNRREHRPGRRRAVTGRAGHRQPFPQDHRPAHRRLSGGTVALATEHSHLRTLTSERYSGRSRHGLRDLLDLESARAIASYLQAVSDSLNSRL